MLDYSMVTTNIELNGYKIVKNLGVVRGITVRSRVCLAIWPAVSRPRLAVSISIYVELLMKNPEEAFQEMMIHAAQRGANAVINMRYDANEVMKWRNLALSLRQWR